MSSEIDMKSYAGETEPAAAVQQNDTNSYQQDASEYSADEAAATPQEPNPQELNFRALTQEVDRMKAEREAEKKDYQLQIDMLRANIAQNAKPLEQPQERKFLDGMKDDDVPSVGEIRKEWEQKEAMYQSRLEELQVAQMHPDYAEVMQKYLTPLVQQKPHLVEGIQGARNKALFAYELAKMAQHMQEHPAAAPLRSENAQRIVENSKKPGTLSQAGGQGALSKADYYASMSDQEFMRMASQHIDAI